MPLRDLRAIYEVLFRDGVMVAKKDKRPQVKHPEVESVSNLQVIRAMGSLKSKGYVNETFAWRHFYWYLTNDGIVYLRDYLRLPPEIVPASLQRVRKPAATLAIAHRAARVQSVEGPTSYVPKPGRRGEAESQEALVERQGYRHRAMGPGEREGYSDRTPRFRGRPLAAEPVRPKASWEVEDQAQALYRKGSSLRSEPAAMEESMGKRFSRQQFDVRNEKPITASQERKVSEVQRENAPTSVQRIALKQEVSESTLKSVSSKTALPLGVAAAAAQATGAVTSKMSAEASIPKINKEKPRATDDTTSIKPNKMVTSHSSATTLPDEGMKEERTTKVIEGPVKSAEVKSADVTSDKTKSQTVTEVATVQEASSLNTPPAPAIKIPANKDVKVEKTKVPVNSVEVKAPSESAGDKLKLQAVITKAAAQETSKPLTDTPVITKPVEEENIKCAKVKEEIVKPTELKTTTESKIDHEAAKKTTKVAPTQESIKSPPDSTTIELVMPRAVVKEISEVKETQDLNVTKLSSVSLPGKSKADEVTQKTTIVTESTILEDKTVKLTKPIQEKSATEIIKKPEINEEKVIPQVKQDEKIEKNSTTEEVTESIQAVEGSSKSKRKKKKSPADASKSIKAEDLPDSKSEREKSFVETPSEEVAENTLLPKPVITPEPLAVCTSIKTEGAPPLKENKTEIDINGGQIQKAIKGTNEKLLTEASKQTISEVESPALEQTPPVPQVDTPDNAHMKNEAEKTSIGEMTPAVLCTEEKVKAELLPTEPLQPEATTITHVETVTVQKITQVQVIEASPKPAEKTLAPLPPTPTEEAKSPLSSGKGVEESSKGKKKGKGKKQAQTPLSDINTKPVALPEAEALSSTNITSLPEATVKDIPVMASQLTEVNVLPKMTPERMCSEETRQAAAVLSEAPADKGEVEPPLLFAEKIKREVPKPKTSSSVRKAHAAGELASAAPVVTVEAAVAPAQASPLAKQEEPPKVAQPSSQAAERSTEKRLCLSEASKKKEEKRDLQEDTPSATATPAAAQPEQPHLGDTCESVSLDTDEAAMRKKIVVVEEIIEVKQLITPHAAEGESSPPPVQQAEVEVEGEELDLDVLEELALERALLSGAAGPVGKRPSPEEDWDHSLEEPEEKTWPNFIEGLFRFACLALFLPSLCI